MKASLVIVLLLHCLVVLADGFKIPIISKLVDGVIEGVKATVSDLFDTTKEVIEVAVDTTVDTVTDTVENIFAPVVEDKYGKYGGRRDFLKGVTTFNQIKFGKAERFKPPTEPDSFSGTKQPFITRIPQVCPQLKLDNTFDINIGKEDCLYMNIYAPTKLLREIQDCDEDQACLDGIEKLPVMFWIFGGGFSLGDGHEFGWYDGRNVVEKYNVIVVAPNYRVGVLGFAAHPALARENLAAGGDGTTGNYGLQDQRRAMQYVQENIHAFGGDKDQVTVYGQSAGAMSICYHLSSDASRGLFNKAILQSGTCDAPEFFHPMSDAVTFTSTYIEASKSKCTYDKTNTDTAAADAAYLNCIRTASTDDLMDALGAWFGSEWPAGGLEGILTKGTGILPAVAIAAATMSPVFPFGPTLDGAASGLLGLPLDEIKANKGSIQDGVKIIMGTNRDEGTIFIPMLDILVQREGFEAPFPCVEALASGPTGCDMNDANMRLAMLHFFKTEDNVDKILAAYPKENYGPNQNKYPAKYTNNDRAEKIIRDYFFTCPSRRAMRAFVEKDLDVYSYFFNFDMTFFEAKEDGPFGLGNYHLSELYYMHDNEWPVNGGDLVETLDVFFHNFDANDEAMAKTMTSYWSSFAKFGDPNQGNDNPTWNKFTSASEPTMQLNISPSEINDLLNTQCDFWDDLGAIDIVLDMSEYPPTSTMFASTLEEQAGEPEPTSSPAMMYGVAAAAAAVGVVGAALVLTRSSKSAQPAVNMAIQPSGGRDAKGLAVANPAFQTPEELFAAL